MNQASTISEAETHSTARDPFGPSFFESYAGQFKEDLNRHLEPDLGASNPPFDVEGLYASLFLTSYNADQEERVREIFYDLVMTYPNVEGALKTAWQNMAAHYVARQRESDAVPDDQAAFTMRLVRYSKWLDDAYFHKAREVRAKPPSAVPNSPSHEKLVQAFSKLAAGPVAHSRMCSITGYYKGVPVECDAEVQEVRDEKIHVHVNRCLATVLAQVPLAVVESPVHDGVLRAHAIHVDNETQVVTLSHFAYQNEGIDRRAHPRVEFAAPVECQLLHNGNVATGRMLDLSVVAAALHFRSEAVAGLKVGVNAILDVVMPALNNGELFEFTLHGEIMKVLPNVSGDPGATRAVFRLGYDSDVDGKLARYIASRQTEILQEISKR